MTQAFRKLNEVVNYKDSLDLSQMTLDLKKHSKNPISKKIYNHMLTISTNFNKQDAAFY